VNKSTYREINEADLGMLVEVTNDSPAIENRRWSTRWLWYVDRESKWPIKVFGVVYEAFKYARIEVGE